MLFTSAYAAEEANSVAAITEIPGSVEGIAPPPNEKETFMMNIGMLLVLAVLFYLLMIRPQQKRFKEHASMLTQLGVGVKIVTQGGLVGVIDKIISDHEVQIDVGNNVRINMMRSYIIGRYEDSFPATSKPANDDKKNKKDKATK
ncbi:MAG: preprotein translocase subunit YajC [Alphaproteobacteria bacterium]|jgi:preprotein translocase subunit YajC|nr:preprotein translocase subunit YajC [Alphaproteobacteria bacterium]MCB1551496.1 preprotein translocase subunit YajC [Alphaproteobacteria bacterium]MCB9985063.1 preprotein translocase subunit YajC [Micavibrio sp.]HRK97445.1 preprotein translocase subunit YajC [Alphaproteobacteria bacterium]